MSGELSMSEAELRALPVSVPVVTAGRAFGLAPAKARKLARVGEFPCRVIPVGARYRVPKSALLEALGLDKAAGPTNPATADHAKTTDERSGNHGMAQVRAIR
jgi:hypothetical protein